MKWLLAGFLALALLDHVTAEEKKTPPAAVLPAVIYRDYLLTHYRESSYRDKPYVIGVRSLDNFSIRSTIEVPARHPRNNFESLFIRKRVLVVGANRYESKENPGIGANRSIDTIQYASADQICDSKWIYVEPTGEPVKPDGVEINPSVAMWGRITELDENPNIPVGSSDIAHTAVTASGDRNLIVFDLLRPVPVKGRLTPSPKIAVTRVVPEDRARTGGFGTGNWGKPEVKPAGEIRAEFDEPFQVYVIANDYYFLTRSGVVYRSPLPEPGQSRTMVATWDKARPRVQFIISDGNRADVHFLITRKDKGGWEYFQLGPNLRPHPLEARDPEESDTPVELVYELATELRKQKVIVTPE